MDFIQMFLVVLWIMLILSITKLTYCMFVTWKILRSEDSTSVSKLVSVFTVIRQILNLTFLSWLIKKPDLNYCFPERATLFLVIVEIEIQMRWHFVWMQYQRSVLNFEFIECMPRSLS